MTQENSTKFFSGVYETPKYTLGFAGPQNKFAVPDGTGIYEDTTHRLVFFPVAGYTKSVTSHTGGVPWDKTPVGMALMKREGENRQNIIKQLLTTVGLICKAAPGYRCVTREDLKVKFVPEPHNPYDPDAILVVVTSPIDKTIHPIGYVPSKINKIIKMRENWFREEDLLVVFRLDDNDKHIIPQLCLTYELPADQNSRFSKIEYD